MIDDHALLAMRHGDAEARAKLAALKADDPGIADLLAEWDRQDAAISALYGPVADEPVPERLRGVVESAARAPGRARTALKRVAAIAALVLVGSAAGWFAARATMPSPSEIAFATRAFRAHTTYAAEKLHPVEVPASDEPHLRDWLSNRLGQPIAPPDLGGFGLRLVGGRIVPDSAGGAALMLYEDARGRRLTLYVARAGNRAETSFRNAENGPLRQVWWVDDALRCAVVGKFPPDRLRDVAAEAYAQLIPG
jgi:anti-sigma factor RsiW